MINLELMVNLMRLISSLVESLGATRILVPSERTTFSSGEIKNANGSLYRVSNYGLAWTTHAMHSIAINAIYVDGVTPPSTPAIWFLDKLRDCQQSSALPTSHSLDRPSDKLAKVPAYYPHGKVQPARSLRRKRHN